MLLFFQTGGGLNPPDPQLIAPELIITVAAGGGRGMVRSEGFALIFRAVMLIAAALAIAISIRYLDIEREQHGEYYSLILFATVGMMFLGAGYDLIALYIA